jgi:flavin-dependent dehydrogenase
LLCAQPNVSFAEAGRQTWDVAVIGAGPAGATAARELSRRGIAVLLVDRADFPRAKVCGCCLNASALETLSMVGLSGLTVRLGGVPLSSVVLAAHGGQARLALPGGAVVSRSALDAALVDEAIAAGAAFLPGTWAQIGQQSSNGRRLFLRRQGRVMGVGARLILAADGLGASSLRNEPGFRSVAEERSWIGAGAILADRDDFFRPGTVFMACDESGYVGAVCLEDGRLNVAAALDPRAVKRAGGPDRVAAGITAKAGWPGAAAFAEAVWRGTPRLTRRPSRRAFPGVLLVGDAAGYVEPFTGEGISWALTSGAAAAAVAVHALRRRRFPLVDAWEGLYRELFSDRHTMCRSVTRALRFPTLVRAARAVLALAPGLAARLVGRMNRCPLRDQTELKNRLLSWPA